MTDLNEALAHIRAAAAILEREGFDCVSLLDRCADAVGDAILDAGEAIEEQEDEE